MSRFWSNRYSGDTVRALTYRSAMACLFAAPLLVITLATPSYAYAQEAEDQGITIQESATAGTIVFTEDTYTLVSPTPAESSQNTAASNSSGASANQASEHSISQEASYVQTPTQEGSSASRSQNDRSECCYQASSTSASTSIERYSVKSDAVAYESAAYVSTGALGPTSGTTSADNSSDLTATAQSAGSSSLVQTQGEAALPQLNALSLNSFSSVSSSKGAISFFDSHPADIVFSSTVGGSITPGSQYALRTLSLYRLTSVSTDLEPTSEDDILEHYSDCLTGTSQGAYAVADEGFHFVWWLDADTQKVLSTSAYYVPKRPEEGWPETWHILAVFEENAYLIILDPNGGTAGGGGGSGGSTESGSVTLRVLPGEGTTLPTNGSSINFTSSNSAFTGWNAVAKPTGESVSRSYFIKDGGTIDAEVEDILERLGHLSLSWTGGDLPTLTLYAQWMKDTIAITYRAGKGGTLATPAAVTSTSNILASETIQSSTGEHPTDSDLIGPQGVTAVCSKRYHFASWSVTGGADLSSTAKVSATLSAEDATQASLYADAEGMDSNYHAVIFEASFAPNSYVIAYDPNGGSGQTSSTSVTYGSTASLASAANAGMTRDGYTLTGWSTSASSASASYKLGSKLTSSTIDSLISQGSLSDEDGASVTLFAQWRQNTSSSAESTQDGSNTPSISNSGQDTQTALNNSEISFSELENSFTMPSDDASSDDTPSTALEDLPSVVSDTVSEMAAAIVDTGRDLTELVPVALLELSGLGASTGDTSVLPGDQSESSSGGITSYFTEMTASEAVETTGAAVAAVAAVGAIAGLMSVGASIVGATAAGAAAIGTATTIGLSSVVDMAADLAAASSESSGLEGVADGGIAGEAAGIKNSVRPGAASKKRKEEDDDDV